MARRGVDRKTVLKAFGKSLRDFREQRGMSQEGLAAAAGLHRNYVGGIERGERNLALISIVRLAKALDVAPAELLAEK
jgi:transcriptional regulator with XRE-family HTH domain